MFPYTPDFTADASSFHYVDAKPLDTDVVEIQVVDSLGRPCEFNGGRVSLTLHFTKRVGVTNRISRGWRRRDIHSSSCCRRKMSPYVPYFTADSTSFYDQYYRRQAGEGLQVYRGRRHLGRQSGAGIGSLFSGLMRAVALTLKDGGKSLAKRGLAAAANVAGDFVRGDNSRGVGEKTFRGARKGSSERRRRSHASRCRQGVASRKRKRARKQQKGGKRRLRETIF